MKVEDLFENKEYYKGTVDSPLITEDLNNVVTELKTRINRIMQAMNNKENRELVERQIKEFADKYGKIYVALRTVLAVEQHLNKGDNPYGEESYKPTVLTMGAMLTGTISAVKKALMDFVNYAKKRSKKILGTLQHFDRTMQNDLKTKMRGSEYMGSAFIEEFLKNLDRISQGSANYVKRYKEVTSAMGENFDLGMAIAESIVEYDNNGLLESMSFDLTEGAEATTSEPFFAVVKYGLYKGDKKQAVKHGYSLMVSDAPDAARAEKEILRNARKSMTYINKQLKKSGLKVANIGDIKLHQGIKQVKRMNVQDLVGANVYSRGLYVMDGFTDVNKTKVGKLPDIADQPYAVLTSKGSLTRYLNKTKD